LSKMADRLVSADLKTLSIIIWVAKMLGYSPHPFHLFVGII